MVPSTKAGIVLLSALFSAGASDRIRSHSMTTPRQAERRAPGGHDESQDSALEYDGELSNRENYFHYHRLPEYDNYEFGYRRGNDFHMKERFEKGSPVDGHFRIKVRWADKTGGHGEHYWDYNHAGRNENSEEETRDEVGKATSTLFETENPTRQHQKRQLFPERGGVEMTAPTTSSVSETRNREAEDFLRSFHREIGGVFDLEWQNRNFFSGKRPSAPTFDTAFPFVLEASKGKD